MPAGLQIDCSPLSQDCIPGFIFATISYKGHQNESHKGVSNNEQQQWWNVRLEEVSESHCPQYNLWKGQQPANITTSDG